MSEPGTEVSGVEEYQVEQMPVIVWGFRIEGSILGWMEDMMRIYRGLESCSRKERVWPTGGNSTGRRSRGAEEGDTEPVNAKILVVLTKKTMGWRWNPAGAGDRRKVESRPSHCPSLEV